MQLRIFLFVARCTLNSRLKNATTQAAWQKKHPWNLGFHPPLLWDGTSRSPAVGCWGSCPKQGVQMRRRLQQGHNQAVWLYQIWNLKCPQPRAARPWHYTFLCITYMFTPMEDQRLWPWRQFMMKCENGNTIRSLNASLATSLGPVLMCQKT